MAFNSAQITLVANTATPLLVQGSTGTKFLNISGNVTDPLPVAIQVASGTVYVGGPNVSASNGFLLTAGVPLIFNVYSNDIPYAYGSAVAVSVLVARQ
jgi:hypothetical protein